MVEPRIDESPIQSTLPLLCLLLVAVLAACTSNRITLATPAPSAATTRPPTSTALPPSSTRAVEPPSATPSPAPTTTPASTANCPEPLDEETLNNLSLSMDSSIGLMPGDSYDFELGVIECCYFSEPVDACAIWSVEPAEGATIDPHTGVLQVDPATPNGAAFTIRADVESGRRLVSIGVYVFTPEANPLVGNWREEAHLGCGTGQMIRPEAPMQELIFKADGTFTATWFPFEVYVDYWGPYSYDLDAATLELEIESGNYIPEDFDGSGRISFDPEGRLLLKDIWLGSPPNGAIPSKCGHRFTR
ncbi:MAG TPA: hypothetical protein VER55_12165 [Ardenticatenaceae bacterium]|nr:hypothetical protein [Ardenticatenaceae bacterium]